jgi:pyroglutamyl-peptidase
MRTILITGFGRFPGAPANPSGVIATRLARRRRPALAATRRVAHVFPTCYAAVDRELPMLLARETPAAVVLFGLAGRARHLRIEEWARNRLSAFPDAERRRPAGRIIAPLLPARRTNAPISRLVAAVRATGLVAVRSRNAGGYLCNYAYWHALGGERRPGGPVVIFVHVPPVPRNNRPVRKPDWRTSRVEKLDGPKRGIKEHRYRGEIDRERRRRRAAYRLDDLVRASEAILVALIHQTRC